MNDDLEQLIKFINMEEFEIGTYPGTTNTLVVHSDHLRAVIDRLKKGERLDLTGEE